MKKIFLGRAWHWALLALAAVLFWYCGSNRLHVVEFNWFVIAVTAGTALTIAAIVLFHRPGEQVTRDPLATTSDETESDLNMIRD